MASNCKRFDKWHLRYLNYNADTNPQFTSVISKVSKKTKVTAADDSIRPVVILIPGQDYTIVHLIPRAWPRLWTRSTLKS